MAIVGHCGQENRCTTNYYQCLPSQVPAISCSPPGVLRTEHYLRKITSISPTIFSQYYLSIRNVIKARFCQSFYHNKRFSVFFEHSVLCLAWTFIRDNQPQSQKKRSVITLIQKSLTSWNVVLKYIVNIQQRILTLLAKTTVSH